MANPSASADARQERVFPALLKYWRGTRGMSQLDLALTAEVSSRHLSFLETGRSQPSVEMVHLLTEALDVPLRDRNDVLRAAGFAAEYPEPEIPALLQGPLGAAVDTMCAHHEPYPMMVVDGLYNVVQLNTAGTRMLALAGAELGDDDVPVNLLRVMFDPAIRELYPDWEGAAGPVLRRLQREVLQRPQDARLAELMADLLESAALSPDWRQPGPTAVGDPMLVFRLQLGELKLAFLTTITAFNAPQNVTLDELRIESWFPMDAETEAACAELLS
jgi:transcriptional regulator with XRE-family HTH domain